MNASKKKKQSEIKTKSIRAIGLMSGTSLDGIDAALIESDGMDYTKALAFSSKPYSVGQREVLRKALGCKDKKNADVIRAEEIITQSHIAFLQDLEWSADLIGFHGQTIHHDPSQKLTVQIGNAQELADALKTDVIADFRQNDILNGGQGAPLIPIYHQALVRSQKKPVGVINIGGVANITWIGCGSGNDDLLAFDCGPGNALMDDFIQSRLNKPFDEHGLIARKGKINQTLLKKWLSHPYLQAPPPKSLDRNTWTCSEVEDMSTHDGLATLLAFSVDCIKQAQFLCPSEVSRWFVSGGGRHNAYFMELLEKALEAPVNSIDALGADGDAVEAQGFAYLAIRSYKDLPLSFPGTTGVAGALKGGIKYEKT